MVREISCHDNTLQLFLHKDEDPRVAETAVVGYGHEDYGEGNYISHYINGVSLNLTDFNVALLAASLRNVPFGLITNLKSVKC